jgi:cobalamin biosynthesis Mg chelatase CobN
MKARRERRRAKLEAKKARQRARVDAAKGKQKSKSKKARPAAPAAPIKKIKRPRVEAADADASEPIAREEKTSSSITKTKRSALSGKSTWILALAVVVFVAAAIYAALVSR